MQRLCTKITLAGLLFSLMLSANAGFIGVGLGSIGNNIHRMKTETKILVGLGAVAALGIGYLIYRAYNPTDEEIITAAQVKINTAQNIVNLVPVSDPLDEKGLQAITTQLSNKQNTPANLRIEIQRSINDLNYHRKVITERIEKYQQANKYVPTDLDTQIIDWLLPQLQIRLTVINTHKQYFTLGITHNQMNNKYSEALENRTDMQKLVPIIRKSQAQFPFLAYVKGLNEDTQTINTDLAQNTATPANPSGEGAPNYKTIYDTLRTALIQIATGLKVIQGTILSSQDHKDDQARKDKYDAEQRKLELERQRIAQEQERIRIEAAKAASEKWARQEKLRIEREKLELEKQKLALAQQQAGQPQPR